MSGEQLGETAQVWTDTDVTHLLVDGARVTSIHSHLSAK
jgi:hypothetical protein